MKIFILLLILSSFLQASIWPVNFCLVLLICRSFVIDDQFNYWLAIFAGVLIGLLTAQNLGFWPLVFVAAVKLGHILRRIPISINALTILPAVILLSLASKYLEQLFFKTSVDFVPVIIETLLAFVLYWVVLFLEERVYARRDVKLKIRN